MAITQEALSSRYPVLYHMATPDSWPSIQVHGLLSSQTLTDLFRCTEDQKRILLSQQRKEGVHIRHAGIGAATLRDQKPLSEKSLARCLTGITPAEWYQKLNERVFFWLNRDRLKTLMSAAEYKGRMHTVLHIDTAKLLERHAPNIELAAMNTGNTRPFAHPRGVGTFRSMSEYPYESRRKLPDYGAVVELTVLGGVPDVRDFVLRVEHATQHEGGYDVNEVLYTRPG